MARINYEDKIEGEPEFRLLVKLVDKDDDRARGMLMRWFKLAQRAFKSGGVVSREEINKHELGAMILSGWAVPEGDGFQALGAKKHFAWLKQRADAGHERANGPRDEHGRFTPADHQRTPSGPPADASELPAAHQPLTLTLSPAPSLVQLQNKESIGALAVSESRSVATVSNLPTKEEKAIEKAEEKRRAAAKANSFVGAYVKAYQTRFPGSRPEDLHDPKVRGQIMALAKDYPIERLCELIQVYFQLEAKWFGTKGYDFMTFRNNLQVIGQALDSGTDPSGAAVDWNRVFA